MNSVSLFQNQTFLTVLSGVLVFIFSQLFIEYFLNPIKEYKKLKARVAYVMVFYADRFANPVFIEEEHTEKWREASDELRKTAAEVKSFAQGRPLFNPFIKSKKELLDVGGYLIGLSNSCFKTDKQSGSRKDNYEYISNIYKILNLEQSF